MGTYWFAVFNKALWDSFTFIGQSKTGIAYSIVVGILTITWLWRKHGGWGSAMRAIWQTLGEGLLIGIAAFTLIYFGHLVYEPFLLDADMQARRNGALTEKMQSDTRLMQCGSQLSMQALRSDLLQTSVTSQQTTVNSQQNQMNTQQETINSCVISLGKMNPKVREEIVVISVPLYTFDNNGKLAGNLALLKSYASELFVTTNETESSFHGILRCTNPFTFLEFPKLPASSQTVFVATAVPNAISDREYEISATASGTEWSPARPAYMRIRTDTENAGQCTFTPK
jgi:hypothetical protein